MNLIKRIFMTIAGKKLKGKSRVDILLEKIAENDIKNGFKPAVWGKQTGHLVYIPGHSLKSKKQ